LQFWQNRSPHRADHFPDHQAATRHRLSHPLYRTIWICILAANISVWMQNVVAAWLMTSLTRSPLMVALIQTATTLPAFLFCLPARVLADQVDRRRLLIIFHTPMLCTSALLSVLVRPVLMGCCWPAWVAVRSSPEYSSVSCGPA
jgi:MFS family permease